MAGTILENLSGGKLSILVATLLICQLVCFLIGGLIAPIPASHQNILGMTCRDNPLRQNDTNFWIYSRGADNCNEIPQEEIGKHYAKMANQIVYVFQMPIPRDGQILDYSRWQQNLIGVLQVEVAYENNILIDPRTELTIDARLAYRNKGDPDNNWKLYAYSLEKRFLDCTPIPATGYHFNGANMVNNGSVFDWTKQLGFYERT